MSKSSHKFVTLVSVLLATALATGCVNTKVKRVNTVAAEHAEQEIPQAQLLNVNIAVFDPGYTEPVDEDSDIFPEVRKAESAYFAHQLRDTLQNTGQWGAVRVVPQVIDSSELQVSGEILHSDGEVLELRIRAVDAAGREWMDKKYEELAAELSYRDAPDQADAFQDIYNRIANDLLALRRAVSSTDLANLRDLSELRFASDLAPDAFARHLSRKNGQYQIVSRPAENDPNLARIRQIRERDYGVIDALDQHYGLYSDRIANPYDDWREASYREKAALGKLRSEALGRMILGAAAIAAGIYGVTKADTPVEGLATQAAIVGGAVVFKSGLDKRSESKIHVESLKELGESLEGDLKPRTVELDEQTITLTGSAEAQYEKWRGMLRQIYLRESGSGGTAQQRTGNDL